MTKKEAALTIIEQKGGCYSVHCQECPLYSNTKKECCFALITTKGNCSGNPDIVCARCPLDAGDACSNNNVYKKAINWLINNGHKDELLKLLI